MTSSPRVLRLSESLINKIAAGEVLERPASAVKELVENAIDAEAGRIRIELEGGGRSLLRVLDDGLGMSREDAVLALKRHATSKIRTDEDLFAIRTLGFRGEALPSIAEVSRFELETGRAGEEAGTRILVDGGELQRVEDAPNPGGTDIRVRRLFFNTPVRLKFLKTPRTEMSHVTQVVTRLAMAHPHIAFQLVSDGRTLLDTPRSDDLAGRVTALLGPSVTRSMHSFAGRAADVGAEGLISDPGLHRSTNAGVHLFVNGRFVRDRTLMAAVLAAFRAWIPKGRYPVAVLFVDVPPDLVDVNVHPAKTEVRFRDGRRLFRFLSTRIEDRLREVVSGSASSELDAILEPQPVQGSIPLPATDSPTFWGARRASLMDRAPVPPVPEERPLAPTAEAPRPPDAGPTLAGAPPLRPDGSGAPLFRDLEVLSRYDGLLLCSGGGDLVVVDPEAARRRVLFDTLCGRVPGEAAASRRLLVPRLVEVDRSTARDLVLFEPLLGDVGVDVSDFGDGTISLHVLPEGGDPLRARPLVEALGGALRGRTPADSRELRLQLAGILVSHLEPRSEEAGSAELAALFVRLDGLDLSLGGPGGGRVCARFSRADVDAWFRKQRP